MNYIAYTSSGKSILVDSNSVDVSTSLSLSGRNFNEYDETFWSNIVHLLENFSGPYKPNEPLAGQLWYDNFNQQLKLYSNSSWVNITPSTADTTNFIKKTGDIVNGNLAVSTPSTNTAIANRKYVESKVYTPTFNGGSFPYIQNENSYVIAQTIVTNASLPISLPVEMANTKYAVLCTVNTTTNVTDAVYCTVYDKTTTSFKISVSGVFDSIACVITGFSI